MRLIDADALEKILAEKFQVHYGKSFSSGIHDFFRCVVKQIRKAPTIEAEPVKHGRWIKKDLFSMYHKMHNCSECGEPVYDNGKPFNYCPNCGAKMRGGADHD